MGKRMASASLGFHVILCSLKTFLYQMLEGVHGAMAGGALEGN